LLLLLLLLLGCMLPASRLKAHPSKAIGPIAVTWHSTALKQLCKLPILSCGLVRRVRVRKAAGLALFAAAVKARPVPTAACSATLQGCQQAGLQGFELSIKCRKLLRWLLLLPWVGSSAVLLVLLVLLHSFKCSDLLLLLLLLPWAGCSPVLLRLLALLRNVVCVHGFTEPITASLLLLLLPLLLPAPWSCC
jgi:hypothetical protein